MDVDNISRSTYESRDFRRRLDTPTSGLMSRLRQGSYSTMKDLYIAAALHARVADHSAQTSNCTGETESIYPFIGGVVDPDTLARTLLFSEPTETDGSHRSPLPVQTSRAERKVARDMWDTSRDLRADISGEGMSPQANSRATAAANPAPQASSPSITSSPVRRGTREDSNLANDLLTALRSASPVRMPSSGGKFGGGSRTTSSFQPQAGARAVLDATSAQRIQNQLLSPALLSRALRCMSQG